MQGSSKPDQEFLDAAAVCGHLLGKGSVPAFLAEHRRALFPAEMFEDLCIAFDVRPILWPLTLRPAFSLAAIQARCTA